MKDSSPIISHIRRLRTSDILPEAFRKVFSHDLGQTGEPKKFSGKVSRNAAGEHFVIGGVCAPAISIMMRTFSELLHLEL